MLEQIGQVGGVISGAQGVYISGHSFNNVDVAAGTVGNVRSGFTVLGSGSNGGSAAAALNGSGGSNNATAGGHATGSGDANQAAATGANGGSGVADNAAVQGPTANHGLLSLALGNVSQGGGVSVGADAQAVQAASAGQQGGKASVIKVAPSGLSKQNPDPNGNYLFETRSQFANLSDWISSDYLLQALKLDPATTQKRLGDAFYEQNLVRDQLAELTGRTIASGAASDAKYEEMMNSAVSYAQEWGLRPGIALTAEQVSQLTSDIVWLESQTVSLPGGSVQTVLVPKVYLAHVADGSVKAGGALVTGDSVVIDVANLTNRGGVIDGSNASGTGRTVLVAANDLVNQGGTIKGNDVVLQAGRDLINQTLTATQSYSTADNSGSYTSVANQASIIATGALSATAARDVIGVGGVISAGGAASIAAGRDVSFTTAQTGSTFQQVVGVSSMVDSTVGHQLSQLSTGTDLTLSAGRDLTLSGTQAAIGTSGVGDGLLMAGRTVTVAAVTNESDSDHHGDATSKTNSTAVHNDQTVVGSSIGASGALTVAAGLSETASLNVTASNLASGGALSLSATGDVNILSASESHLAETSAKWSSSGFLKSSSTSMADSSASTLAIGSNLSGGSVAIKAGNDITIGASQVTAQDALQLSAGRDLTVTTATASSSESHFLDTKKSGVTLDVTHGVGYLSAADKSNQSGASTTQVGSVLSGGSVTAVSGRDTVIQGSTVVADNDLTLVAARNLSLLSAQDTASQGAASNSKQSGMIGSFGQPAVGTVKSSQDGTSSSVTQVGSQVASLGGDVTILAGEKYTQTSSQVLAPAGDISISAKDVLINAAFDTSTSSQHSESSKVALGGSANIPVVSSVQGMVSLAQSAKDTGSGRMQGLAAVTAAMQAQDAYNGVANVADTAKNGTGVKISVSLGSSKSESTTVQTASTAVGSKIAAGGNVSIAATGGGKDSNLTAIGSDISGGGNVTLVADNAINLLAAENTASQHSTNSSSGSSIGIGYAFGGEQNGFTLEVVANKARGNAEGDDLTYSNSHVSAGGAATLHSGGDTTLKGGVVTGNTVVADIGGDLKIESLQDSSTYASKQTSAGFGLSICIPPFCYGASSASVSASQAKVNGDFLSVTEQSGIKAGDGGYQIKVGGNTDLVGAVITSNQAAVDAGKNSLSTASLTYSDLVNKDVYDASGFALSATVKGTYGDQSGASQDTKNAIKDAGPVKPGASAGVGSASGSQGSITQSGISGGTLTITDAAKQAATGQDAAGIARDVTTENAADKAGALTQAWNGQELAKEVQAQVAITQAFSAQAPKAIASFANGQANDLRIQAGKAEKGSAEQATLEAEASKWDEGGIYRTALHTLSGALSGGVGGAVGAAMISNVAEQLNDFQHQAQLALEERDVSPEAAKVLSQGLAELLSAGIGSAVGGATGAAAALVTDTNNRQLHLAELSLADRLAAKSGGKFTAKQIADALRASGNAALGESVVTGVVVAQKDWNNPKLYYDGGGMISTGSGNNQFMTQIVVSIVAPELQSYILNNTGGENSPYEWDNPHSSPSASVNPFTPASNGCITAECAAGVLPNVRDIGKETIASGLLQGTFGAGQSVGGGAMVGGGLASCPETLGAGCVVAFIGGVQMFAGWDNVNAATKTVSNVQYSPTVGGSIIQDMTGWSAGTSELLYGVTQFGTGAAGTFLSRSSTLGSFLGASVTPKTNIDALLPDADFLGQFLPRTDLGMHLEQATISGKQISGGHDMDNFYAALKNAGGTSTSVEAAPGIYNVTYELPNAKKPAFKTVYDSSVYPAMPAMAEEAANLALYNYQLTGKVNQVVAVNGVKFTVPINTSSGVATVRTAYPSGVVK